MKFNISELVYWFLSKTTVLHVHHAFQYISLTSTAGLRRETSLCDVLWRTGTYDDEFSFLFLNLNNNSNNIILIIQLQEKSPVTFVKLSGSKKTQQKLKGCKFIFQRRFHCRPRRAARAPYSQNVNVYEELFRLYQLLFSNHFSNVGAFGVTNQSPLAISCHECL